MWLPAVLLAIIPVLHAHEEFVTRIEDVDLSPPATKGAINHTVIRLPVADASGALKVSKDRKGDGVVFTLTNTSGYELIVWTKVMFKNASGVLSEAYSEQRRLTASKEKRMTLTYQQDNNGKLWGEYSLVIACAFYKEWGDEVIQSRTESGKAVDIVLKDFDKKVKEYIKSARK